MTGDEVITGGYATYARVKALETRVAELEANLKAFALAQQIESLNISTLIDQRNEAQRRILNLETKLLELKASLLAHFRARGEL